MAQYTLLGTEIEISEAAQRYYDLHTFLDHALEDGRKQYIGWYHCCSDIQAVLNTYTRFADRLVEDLVIQPLFKQLTSCGVYDVSENSYRKRCKDSSSYEYARDDILDEYHSIGRQESAEREYRAMRKASRGRWQGGGFGLGGALKGAATAGALNLASGLGHSVANAVGNAGSAASAAMSKSGLLSSAETINTLWDGIAESMVEAVKEHISLVNEHNKNYICSTFDPDRGKALYDNALKISNKREQLLAESIELYPWNADALKYAFTNYPTSRKSVWEIAGRFHVDLNVELNSVLMAEYTPGCQGSTEEAEPVMKKIRAIMDEYGVKESTALNTLERACLARICDGYQSADEETCKNLIEKVRMFHATEKNQEIYVKLLQSRIEELWAKEDGNIFDNLFLATNIRDKEAVLETIKYIKQKGRTSSSDKYLTALYACNSTNIGRARVYKSGLLPGVMKGCGIACFVGAAGSLLFRISFLWTVILIGMGIMLFLQSGTYKKAWDALTIDGELVHPALSINITTIAQKDYLPWIITVALSFSFLAVFYFISPIRSQSTTNHNSYRPVSASVPSALPTESQIPTPAIPSAGVGFVSSEKEIIGVWVLDHVNYIDGTTLYAGQTGVEEYLRFLDDNTYLYTDKDISQIYASGTWEYIASDGQFHLIDRLGKERIAWKDGNTVHLATDDKISTFGVLSSKAERVPELPQSTANQQDEPLSFSTYLLPSNTQYITNADLDKLTQTEVVLARNEIYARHGYSFQSENIRSYFESQDWYYADPSVNASTFGTQNMNDYERANLELIQNYEKKMGWK